MKAELATAMGWSLTTIAIYAAALRAYRWRNAGPFLIPVATGAALIVLVIKLCGVAYPAYAEATGLLRSLIGPATVALAVPLFVQFQRLRPVWRELSVALLAGCMVAILSSVTLARALGASSALVASVAPKSATMPIAMPVAERFGGQASIAALAVAITGVAGAVIADPILRIIGVQDARVRGFSVGLTAHAIGLAREMQGGPVAGGFAALAMCLNGVATAAMMPVIFNFLSYLRT